ncbi:delta-60 repeat domain-containing protein [Pseudomonas sp. NPDC089534]|uniref:delta-60 repeat domain-containing protein n=1 Tax=Pseudomonas sp. NPDC089534 TaxID=3364468 RepID=UPI0038273FEE
MAPFNASASQAGSLDPDFADAGIQTLKFPGYVKTQGMGLAVGPSGAVMVSALLTSESGQTSYGLARLLADGRVDPSFGEDGYLSGQFANARPSRGGPLAIQADGAILLCAAFQDTALRWRQVIARFLADGSPDLSFGEDQNGYLIVPMRVPALEGSVSGRILLARSRPGAAVHDRILYMVAEKGVGLLARYDLAGRQDLEFSQGWVHIEVPGRAITLNRLLELETGRILLCGKADGVQVQGLVLAYGNLGEVDTDFGLNGVLLLNVQYQGGTAGSHVRDLLVQSPSRLLAVGEVSVRVDSSNVQHALMVGLTPQGATDSTFNGGAPVIAEAAGAFDLRHWLSGAVFREQAAQRIIAVGQTTHAGRLLLSGGYLADGAVDPDFDAAGVAELKWTPDDCCAQDGRLLVIGSTTDSAQIIRMLT